MGVYRLKHSFSSGELSPLMDSRSDFDRYKNGCKVMRNFFVSTQGPAVRRPGFQFIYDLTSLGLDVNDPRIREIPFTFNQTQTYAMIFYMHTDGNPRVVFGTGQGLLIFSSSPPAECPPGTPWSPTPGDIISLTLPADWDIDNFDWAQSGDEMYFAQSSLKQHVIQRYDHECWVLSELSFTMAPADWSDENGWPETVAFHQQRLLYGSNKIRTRTIWASKAGSFLDFTQGTNDDDAFTFTLDSGTQNKIEWMMSAKHLMVGTIGDEWTVQGSTRSSLTPSNILAESQTANGSDPVKPLKVGKIPLYVEQHGRSLNEFIYDYNSDGYDSNDMLVLAPHLTENYSIKVMSYQQTPDSIVWAVRNDGALLGMTYKRLQKLIGWHVHTTDGEFKAITCIPGDQREDEVWVVVRRQVNGQDKYYLEKLETYFKETDAEHGRFLDSHLVYFGPPTSTISGLDHLEAKTVDILADGTAHPSQVVESGGITLNAEYSHVVVGLPFVSEVRPFLLDVADRQGTSIGRMQRVIGLALNFYRTLGGYVGRYDQEDGESEEELPFRVPGDLMGQAVPLFTGIYDWDFEEGYDRTSEYFIRQYQPFPMTVRGVTDLVEVMED